MIFAVLSLLLLTTSYLRPSLCYHSLCSHTFVLVGKGETFQEFASIQEAIDNAENGSTIFVPSGIYYEHVIINKTISLIGENISTTIIDGNNGGTVVQILADNVSVSGFTIRYSGWGWTNNGIYVHFADNVEIRNNYFFTNCHNIRLNYSKGSLVTGNTIDGNGYGIRLLNSENCTASYNDVSNCIGGVHLEYATNCTVKRNSFFENSQGIRLYSPCTYNAVFENFVYNNTYDGMIDAMPGNTTFLSNSIFHNNFVNNTNPFIYRLSGFLWDDGYPSGGNYWSTYNGTDLHSGPYQNETGYDGIGDSQYLVGSYDKDQYPLIHPYGSVHNLETNLTYLTILAAVNAPETLNGHSILVRSGVYHEHLTLNKTLSLRGEDQATTIIDGEEVGTVLTVKADNVTVTGFTMRNSGLNFPPYGDDCGLLLDHSSRGNISHNSFVNNRIGVYLYYSESNFLGNNNVHSNSEDGIWLWYSGNNTLVANSVTNNMYNFGVFGGAFSDFNNSIDTTNTVDGMPIMYIVGAEDQIFNNETIASTVYLIDCANITVRDLVFVGNGHGVFCYNVTDSRIQNVSTLENNYGIYLQNSANNIVDSSYCLDNWVAYCLEDSQNNTVQNNIALNGEKGISLYKANNNTIEGNKINNTYYGIRLYLSSSNKILHNNLIDNTQQADLINSYQNIWDDGFEGNFWNNYLGADVNMDGVGEDPYVIDGENRDEHPLVGVFNVFVVNDDGEDYHLAVSTNSTILSFAFESLSDTFRLKVEGENGTFGYCRVRLPKALIGPEITVVIDDGLTEVLHANYSLCEDDSSKWIYFAYVHSTHDVVIVPEFVSFVYLLTLVFAISLAYLLKKSDKSEN